jgi:hypothetical protein
MSPMMIDIITKDVRALFKLDEEELFFLKAEYGKNYLDIRFENEPKIAESLLKAPAFWAWWCELWAERDRKLIQSCKPSLYGNLRYTFPIGKTVQLANGDSYTPTDSTVIEDVWEFYKSYHHWRKIQYYPNYQLINACLKEQVTDKIYVKL